MLGMTERPTRCARAHAHGKHVAHIGALTIVCPGIDRESLPVSDAVVSFPARSVRVGMLVPYMGDEATVERAPHDCPVCPETVRCVAIVCRGRSELQPFTMHVRMPSVRVYERTVPLSCTRCYGIPADGGCRC